MSAPDPSALASGEETGPSAHLRRAEALSGFGRPREAIAELRRGIGEFPDSCDLWSRLAWLLHQADEPVESRQAAERALALDPDDLPALLTLALLAVDAEDAGRAHAFADRLLALDPQLPIAHLVKAMAFKVEPGGAWSHRGIIRDAAYYAVGLAPEEPTILHFAARTLLSVVEKQEVAALVDRALALDPDDPDLQMLAARLHARSDAQAMGWWTRVLAQNPRQSDAALAASVAVWERTRMVAAIAVWGMVALAPPLMLYVAILGAVNLWQLLVGLRRSAPRGFLRRSWSAPAWARPGVVLCFVGAAWPLLAIPIVASGRYGLLVLLPLMLLAGETVVVLAADAEERRILAGSAVGAPDYARSMRGYARRGWFRISFGIVATLVAVGVLVAGNAVVGLLLLVLAAALAAPPALTLLLNRRMARADAVERLRRPGRALPRLAAVIVVAAAVLAALAAVLPPAP